MPKKTGVKNGVKFKRYSTYAFKSYDPVLDVIDYLKDFTEMSEKEIAAESNLARATLANWRNRKVRRPKFATIAAAMGALGQDFIPISDSARRTVMTNRRNSR
jgi:hypothetical protein